MKTSPGKNIGTVSKNDFYVAGKRSIDIDLTIPEIDDGQTRIITFLPYITMKIDADYETIDTLEVEKEPIKKISKMENFTSFIIDSKRAVKSSSKQIVGTKKQDIIVYNEITPGYVDLSLNKMDFLTKTNNEVLYSVNIIQKTNNNNLGSTVLSESEVTDKGIYSKTFRLIPKVLKWKIEEPIDQWDTLSWTTETTKERTDLKINDIIYKIYYITGIGTPGELRDEVIQTTKNKIFDISNGVYQIRAFYDTRGLWYFRYGI